MVTFKLIEETDEYLIYWYYTNGNESLKPGIIIVDKINGKIDITELAEDDCGRTSYSSRNIRGFSYYS